MVRKRKIPERMCVACREKKPKRELIRVVRSPDNAVSLDYTGKKSGRGAYICGSPACFERAKKNKALGKALETNIDEEVWRNLEDALIKGNKERDK